MKPANISQQRIMAQVKKLSKEKLSYLVAAPLPDNIYNWHFTIQGPENTEFHEGLYHGQILLPYQYPFKPPDIVFMNKNGRFETNTKICLTITQYHPEEWNSAWTITTMLQAVISLFAENVQGVGSLSSSADVRKFLAKNSQSYICEKCGPIKQQLTPRPPSQLENKEAVQVSDVSLPKEAPQNPKQLSQQAHTQQIFNLREQLPFFAKAALEKHEKEAKAQKYVQKEKNRKKQVDSNENSLRWDLKQAPSSKREQSYKRDVSGGWDGIERIEIEDKGWGSNATEWTLHAKKIAKNIKKLDVVYRSIKWVD